MLSVKLTPKRPFFKYLKALFVRDTEILKAYRNRDIEKLQELLTKADHWSFLASRIEGFSMLHDAVINDDRRMMEVFAKLPYKEEIINNIK